MKVIVIGAGIGGMATAARLARAGLDVTVFEASNKTGGKCQTEWIGDYAFDTGPSLLTIPAVYRDLFLKTGKRLEHILNLQPVDPAFRYHFADGKEITFPNLSLPKITQEIESAIGKEAADQWHRLMQRAEVMWDVSREPFIESELTSILDLLKRKNILSDLRTISPFASLRSLTSKYTTNPYLTKIIDRYATYSGSDPRKAPAVLLTIAFVESAFGAWHVEGGLGQLSVKLEERLRNLNVEIHLGQPIDKIVTEKGKATGVITASGEFHAADIVVANADASVVYDKLLSTREKSAKSERRRIAKAEPSFSGFSLLLGLDNSKIHGEIPRLGHHNVFFPQNYDAEFDQIFTQKIPVTDPTIYICAPKDPKMVKGGDKEAWSVLINAPLHDPSHGWDWSKNSERYATTIITKMDALGLRVSERLDVMEYRTPLDLANATGAPGGSIYGTSSNSARSAFLRAKNRSPIRNLYCVGGSAHPGGGLPLVGISAELVVNAIQENMQSDSRFFQPQVGKSHH